MKGLRVAAALGALAAAIPAAGHEVLHEVVRGRAVAVRATYADGEPLAYAAFEIFSPADPAVAHAKGRTDRNGWVAFVPDAPGAWRVRIADSTGHGVDAKVDVDAPGAAASPAGPAAPSAIAFVLRPLLGVLLVGAVFAALLAWRRRRNEPR